MKPGGIPHDGHAPVQVEFEVQAQEPQDKPAEILIRPGDNPCIDNGGDIRICMEQPDTELERLQIKLHRQGCRIIELEEENMKLKEQIQQLRENAGHV